VKRRGERLRSCTKTSVVLGWDSVKCKCKCWSLKKRHLNCSKLLRAMVCGVSAFGQRAAPVLLIDSSISGALKGFAECFLGEVRTVRPQRQAANSFSVCSSSLFSNQIRDLESQRKLLETSIPSRHVPTAANAAEHSLRLTDARPSIPVYFYCTVLGVFCLPWPFPIELF